MEDGDNCIVVENFTASIVDLMVANIHLLAPLTVASKLNLPPSNLQLML
jgi:hypothetical protein